MSAKPFGISKQHDFFSKTVTIVLIGLFLILSSCKERSKKDFVVGTFTLFNRESSYLIAAPHGEYDENTGEIVYEFCNEVRWDCLIAEGFRSEQALLNVNRPTEGLRLDEARFTERASLVYAKYLKRIRRLSPTVRFYAEIHGNENPKLKNTIDISSVGLTSKEGETIKTRFGERLKKEGLDGLEVRMDVVDTVHFKATHARKFGVLSFLSPAVHIELPKIVRTEKRAEITRVLTAALPTITAEIFPVSNRLPYRPVIGVNGKLEDPNVDREIAEKIERAGGIPVRISQDDAPDLSGFDGIVLVGGPDINPKRYGEARHRSVKLLSPDRERFDFTLAGAVMSSNLPVLAICLGAEEIWVLSGGTLIQDIPSEIGAAVNHRSGKEGHFVDIGPGTGLERLYGKARILVHSNHHQGFDQAKTPEPFKNVAWSDDGLPEAYEHEDPNRFLMGVLWHPERSDSGYALFRGLVAAARRAKRAQTVEMEAPRINGKLKSGDIPAEGAARD